MGTASWSDPKYRLNINGINPTSTKVGYDLDEYQFMRGCGMSGLDLFFAGLIPKTIHCLLS